MQAVKLLRKKLDAEALGTHLRSLATAEGLEIRVKASSTQHSDGATSLDVAADRLRSGDITALQIRFFERGDWWCDTLLRAEDSFRLVRIREGA